MQDNAAYFLSEIRLALGEAATTEVIVSGEGSLPSVYAVTDLAAASIGAAIAEVAAFASESQRREPSGSVQVNRRLASYWFQGTIRPDGWQLPPVWDDIAGDYRGADGWIRLHTNAPHHRAAALRVLGCQPDRQTVAAAVERLAVEDLENDIVLEGGCAAAMRSQEQWLQHPNGAAVALEPLIDLSASESCGTGLPEPDASRPLAGLRVLDLTRVLAGPVCTRFLAGWGAEVLRIDPLDWNEGVVIPEVVLGKRCARLDLKTRPGLSTLEQLLVGADVLVHGYRSDALEQLGLGEQRRDDLRPGLIDVCLDAYGWTGPWAARRGFDSLVQMSCGIAAAGMQAAEHHEPFPLPVQALDHATGYLMATAVIRGLRSRLELGTGTRARCSLARTARLLMDGPTGNLDDRIGRPLDSDWSEVSEITSWGSASRLRPPCSTATLNMSWDIPAGELGRHSPDW